MKDERKTVKIMTHCSIFLLSQKDQISFKLMNALYCSISHFYPSFLPFIVIFITSISSVHNSYYIEIVKHKFVIFYLLPGRVSFCCTPSETTPCCIQSHEIPNPVPLDLRESQSIVIIPASHVSEDASFGEKIARFRGTIHLH